MSKKELGRYEIIKRLIRKEINGTGAAGLLHLSVRQVRRLKGRLKKHGAKELLHQSRGKQGHNRLGDEEREKIISLLHQHYHDFGPTFASEKLSEDHRLKHDPKTIRRIMIDEELWKPKKKTNGSVHRQWRERKAAYGEMIQFDGSYEHWFEDRGGSGEVCLLAAIDDATGKLIRAELVSHEGVLPVFDFWQKYLSQHGRPRLIYLDKFSTYHQNQAVAFENGSTLTQFQRAMAELRIEVIPANSPQAKGRVERLFGTLQDRLIKELRLADISTIPVANQFLEGVFIPKFNAKFAVTARSDINLHQELSASERNRLSGILSKQTERTIQNDFTLCFKNQWYQLTREQKVTVCKKDRVIVEERTDNSIHIRLRGKYLNHQVLPQRPAREVRPAWVLAASTKREPNQVSPSEDKRPALNHPWRQYAYAANRLAINKTKSGHFNFPGSRTF
mgnify:CR=1 FL=1